MKEQTPPVKCPHGWTECLCTKCCNKECDWIDCEDVGAETKEDCVVTYCSEFVPCEEVNERAKDLEKEGDN